MKTTLTLPLADADIHDLSVGDAVLINGVILTARDTAHRWLHDRFITRAVTPSREDWQVYEQLRRYLTGGVIYHCGPVVRRLSTGAHQIVSAGPTTSIREEPYQADILRHFGFKAIIGKGGMGKTTAQALTDHTAVYCSAVGGAGASIAASVEAVLGVFKLDFGIPEAMWILKVTHFPVLVTMDAHGSSLHDIVRATSNSKLHHLLNE